MEDKELYLKKDKISYVPPKIIAIARELPPLSANYSPPPVETCCNDNSNLESKTENNL